jgi:CheY-like chemotaxis protein
MNTSKYKCILLVDDDEVSNFINEKIIAACRVTDHTHIRHNGLEALEFIRNNCEQDNHICPDVILLDIRMPVMDGFEFLQEFENTAKQLSDRIKIVVLTSSSNPHDVELARKFNVAGYINKPLSVNALRQMIEKLN